VVRSLNEALLAAIELHDLPAPDDNKTPTGARCPVPKLIQNSALQPRISTKPYVLGSLAGSSPA
jgi:hypothetical protein